MEKYYPYTAPHANSGITYKWDINGYYKNVTKNAVMPVYGIIPSRGGKELVATRCTDIYPVMFGMEYMGRGCEHIQFYNEPSLIRCKRCFQSYSKADMLRIYGGIEGMVIFPESP